MNDHQYTDKPRRLARLTLQALTPAVLAVIMAGAASAQDADPPSLVGRIAAINGEVSMHRADDQDWSDAGINDPVTIGDALYVPAGGDARLEIGATDLDLQSDSEIDIAALDQDGGRLRLDSGSLDLRIAALPTADGLFILTPRGTLQLTQPGLYHIDAGTEDQPTEVIAWRGAAQMGEAGAAVTVQSGQMLVVAGTADAPQYSYSSNIGEPPRDWLAPPRVVAEEQRYISPEMTGGEDLYRYGSFQTVAEYGTVWYPTEVAPDWQPYRYGHWEIVAPWGRTWIDDSPWGFAPFHYGRWAFIGNRWGWVPGEYVAHPVYAPALVSFVGGGGFGVSIGFGGGEAVGWIPLAPGEAFRPYYRVGPTYVQNINRTVIVSNSTIINGGPGGRGGVALRFGADHVPPTAAGFANARFATVVPANIMASARPVATATIRVQPEALAHASVAERVAIETRPGPGPERRAAPPGPVLPRANGRPGVAVARPMLPPSHPAGRPGETGRGPRPAAMAPGPAVAPNTHPAPPGMQPVRPEGRPSERPGVLPPPAPPPRPAGMERPNPERPMVPGAGQPVRPEQSRPEAPRPEMNRPEMNRPEAPRPQMNRPEAPKPEARPQAAPPQQHAAPPPPHPEKAPPKKPGEQEQK